MVFLLKKRIYLEDGIRKRKVIFLMSKKNLLNLNQTMLLKQLIRSSDCFDNLNKMFWQRIPCYMYFICDFG